MTDGLRTAEPRLNICAFPDNTHSTTGRVTVACPLGARRVVKGGSMAFRSELIKMLRI